MQKFTVLVQCLLVLLKIVREINSYYTSWKSVGLITCVQTDGVDSNTPKERRSYVKRKKTLVVRTALHELYLSGVVCGMPLLETEDVTALSLHIELNRTNFAAVCVPRLCPSSLEPNTENSSTESTNLKKYFHEIWLHLIYWLNIWHSTSVYNSIKPF